MGAEDYSITTGKIRTFGVVDYVLFSLVFGICGLIGVYYAFKDRNQNSTANFMLAGKSMWVMPVALSLSVTFLSALSLLGNPVEVYSFNTMFCWLVVSIFLAVAAAAHIFVPFFYRLKITTVFEYLEMRFSTPVRILCSVITIIQTLVYFSFILYAPSLALSSVTSIGLWGSVVAIGAVVTFYTTLGGMKAVLWTDSFQTAVIIAGLLAVLIRGSIVTGGFASAWSVAEDNGRIKFDDFSFDPSTRHSFWSVVVGGGFFWMSLYSINQAQVQRCMACPSVQKAQIALWVNLPCIWIMAVLCFMIGVVMFAFYSKCHPEGIITKRDQILPLFVMDILADYDGVPGLFVACIFSGSLSTLSSGLNAISTVTVKDILVPYVCPRLTDVKSTIATKISVVIYGAIGVAFAYLVGSLDRVLQASYSTYSILNGPVFGVFMLGMFFPWANSVGAIVGCITSLVFMSWIGIGAFWHKVSTAKLSPVFYTDCAYRNLNSTTITTTITTIVNTTLSPLSQTSPPPAMSSADPESIPAYHLYTLSYLYYTITGAMVVVVVGLIVSFISGPTKPSSVAPWLIIPLFDTLFPCLPECVLRPLRFGVDHTEKYEKYERELAALEASISKNVEIDITHRGSVTASSVCGKESITETPHATPRHTIYENAGYDEDHPEKDKMAAAASGYGSSELSTEDSAELDEAFSIHM
ncbi:hypothetical protein ACOMHN_065769 [Nucella lapillus]